ncbi:hypothetical protein EDC01DRAFT_632580 [Geopyxis carbonaria]|nr:hypothetical protein EDC01DRAFT_632580 [Geopyxis carbonaria]
MPPTTFSHKLVASSIDSFDGLPQNLPLLDQSVELLCIEQAYPAYWGGTVKGSVETGYEWVPAGTPGSAANYYLGSRVCAAICGKFTGDAKLWWAGYRKDDKPRPNCWKFAFENPEGEDSKPESVIEVSLYDLIDTAFPSNDASQARAELKRFKWDPSAKDALSISAFKYQVMELLTRAGYTNWELQCEEIRDRIEPPQFRERVLSWEKPDEFWKGLKAAVSSWRHDHPYSSMAKKCLNCGGLHETKACRRSNKSSRRDDTTRALSTCDYCGIPGHYQKNCFKYKASLRAESANAGLRTSSQQSSSSVQRGYTSKTGAGAARRPYSSNNRAQNAPNSDPFKSYVCRNCKGVGHLAGVCPSRTTAVSAPNIESKPDKSGKGDSAMYLMQAWNERPDVSSSMASAVKDSSLRTMATDVADDEGIDEFFSLLFAEKSMEFPLYNNLSKVIEKDDVITLGGDPNRLTIKVSDSLDMTQLGPPGSEPPSGPMWTVCSTMRNQDLLTIFDTGAVKAAIPRSTAVGTRSSWSKETPHPISFIKADGTTYKPAGFCPSFKFMFGSSVFDIQAYVVDSAPFQLLLGTEFLWATGAGLFPRWDRSRHQNVNVWPYSGILSSFADGLRRH